MCGNGIRCLAKLAFDRGLIDAPTELDVDDARRAEAPVARTSTRRRGDGAVGDGGHGRARAPAGRIPMAGRAPARRSCAEPFDATACRTRPRRCRWATRTWCCSSRQDPDRDRRAPASGRSIEHDPRFPEQDERRVRGAGDGRHQAPRLGARGRRDHGLRDRRLRVARGRAAWPAWRPARREHPTSPAGRCCVRVDATRPVFLDRARPSASYDGRPVERRASVAPGRRRAGAMRVAKRVETPPAVPVRRAGPARSPKRRRGRGRHLARHRRPRPARRPRTWSRRSGRASADPATHQYPSYYGMPEFRQAVADVVRAAVRRGARPRHARCCR